MCVPLHVFSFMFPFTNLFNCSSLMFLNSFQNMYSGMRLPSLPVSILYRISYAVLPTCISKFAIISYHFLFKYSELILTISMSSPWESGPICISTSCTTQFLLLLHTFLKCPILPHVANIFPHAGHCLGV